VLLALELGRAHGHLRVEPAQEVAVPHQLAALPVGPEEGGGHREELVVREARARALAREQALQAIDERRLVEPAAELNVHGLKDGEGVRRADAGALELVADHVEQLLEPPVGARADRALGVGVVVGLVPERGAGERPVDELLVEDHRPVCAEVRVLEDVVHRHLVRQRAALGAREGEAEAEQSGGELGHANHAELAPVIVREALLEVGLGRRVVAALARARVLHDADRAPLQLSAVGLLEHAEGRTGRVRIVNHVGERHNGHTVVARVDALVEERKVRVGEVDAERLQGLLEPVVLELARADAVDGLQRRLEVLDLACHRAPLGELRADRGLEPAQLEALALLHTEVDERHVVDEAAAAVAVACLC